MKNTINMIYWANTIWLTITFLLYVTFFFGLIAQFILGCFQVISALILFIHWKNIAYVDRRRIYVYWFFTVSYFIGLALVQNIKSNPSFLMLLGMLIIPLIISLYFSFVIYQLRLHLKQERRSISVY